MYKKNVSVTRCSFTTAKTKTARSTDKERSTTGTRSWMQREDAKNGVSKTEWCISSACEVGNPPELLLNISVPSFGSSSVFKHRQPILNAIERPFADGRQNESVATCSHVTSIPRQRITEMLAKVLVSNDLMISRWVAGN